MTDETLPNGDSLPLSALERIDRVCQESEVAWKAGDEPRIERLLGDARGQERALLLKEFLLLELEYRRRKSEAPAISQYQDRFPQDGILLEEVFEQFSVHATSSQVPGTRAECIGDYEHRVMHCRCPHCHNPIEIVAGNPLTDIECPSCGSHFALVAAQSTVSYQGQSRRIAHFELLDQVGTGKFGSVWKARDTELDRIVAVKIPRAGQLDGHEAEQFLREARAAAQVKYSNIVSVHEVGQERRLYS